MARSRNTVQPAHTRQRLLHPNHQNIDKYLLLSNSERDGFAVSNRNCHKIQKLTHTQRSLFFTDFYVLIIVFFYLRAFILFVSSLFFIRRSFLDRLIAYAFISNAKRIHNLFECVEMRCLSIAFLKLASIQADIELDATFSCTQTHETKKKKSELKKWNTGRLRSNAKWEITKKSKEDISKLLLSSTVIELFGHRMQTIMYGQLINWDSTNICVAKSNIQIHT